MSGKVFHTGELPESVRDDGAIGTGMVLQHQDKRYTGASEEVRCKGKLEYQPKNVHLFFEKKLTFAMESHHD